MKEIAKTAGKGIDVGEKFGRFISQFISGPLEQASGIIEDKLKYLRWERQVRLMIRADDFMRELGMPGPTRAVPLKLAIPLLQGGSLEDDDDLQDLWARLLVNAADARSPVTIKRVFVDILQSIGPLEAKILQMLYPLPFEEMRRRGVLTVDMPNSVSLRPLESNFKLKPPSQEVELALANLKRLGCLSHAMTWGGGEDFGIVNLTLLGSAFVEACTLRKKPPTPEDSRR